MRKNLIIAILIFPLLTFAQIDPFFSTDWENDGLKGNVKKVSLTSNNTTRVKTYNPLGYILQIENDYFAAKVMKTYDGDKILLSDEFDENGERTSTTRYDYNPQGLLVSYTTLSEYGTTVGRYEYNPDKTLKSFKRFEGDDTVHYAFLVEYTYQNGTLVEENQFGPNRSPYVWAIYNEQKLCAEYKRWKQNGTLRIHARYVYDENGNLMRWDVEKDGEWQLYCSYKYDDYGNVISKKTIEEDNSRMETYKYEYDSHDNWLKRDKCYGSEMDMHEIETRVIEYY